MSDRDRLLELLRERGAAGVTTFEIRRSGVSGNPSQRKAELEELGYKIDAQPYAEGRRRGRRYVLISEPAGVGAGVHAAVASADPSEDGALFDSDEYRPRRRHDELAA